MTVMVTEPYDALVSAGADDRKAKEAAMALANYDDRFSKIEMDLAVLKWMVASNVAILTKLFL